MSTVQLRSTAGSCALWYVLYTSLSGNVNNSHSLTRISKRLSYFRTDRYTRENMHALPAFYHSTEFGLTEAVLAATCTTWRRMLRTTWKNGPRAGIESISSSWPTADPEAFPSATKSTTGCHVHSPNPDGQRWWFRWAFNEYQPGTARCYLFFFLIITFTFQLNS